jgi:CPA1 family monovalent cation:H+ antiporter
MHFETAIVLLFAVATAVALVARWIKVPYTVALVVAGLALGAAHAFEPPKLTKELLYAVFLPGLLFEAAYHLELKKFVANKIAITSLAVPGVVVAIALTAALLTPAANALHFVDGFELSHGLVFAALIAATDPIAVVALFKSLGAPKRLAVIVEGESLLNDGTAVVLFTLILGAVGGGATTPVGAVLDFVRVVGMGLLVGAGFGFAASKLIQRIDEPMIEITLTTIAAYGSFVVAEQFHFSGVIATVTAGMLCGNYGAATGMSPSTRIAVESFWEYLAFALNSVVFLLIGFSVSIETLVASWLPILVAFAAVVAARGVVVGVVSVALRRTREKYPAAWSAVLIWGGLRGGLSMVLALGLDPSFPHRELLLTMTYGVVVVSILVQGLTMAPLLRRLGLIGAAEDRMRYEAERGLIRSSREALRALDGLIARGVLAAPAAETLRAEYQTQVDVAEARVRDLHLASAEIADEERHAARRHLLQVEKQTLRADLQAGLIGGEAYEELIREVDARLFRLEVERDEPAARPRDAQHSVEKSSPSDAQPG